VRGDSSVELAGKAKAVVQTLLEAAEVRGCSSEAQVAKLYCVSDVLYNANASIPGAALFKPLIQVCKLHLFFLSLCIYVIFSIFNHSTYIFIHIPTFSG